MKRTGFIFILLVSAVYSLACQTAPLTVAERSGFTSTSDYNDVINFISQLKKMSKHIRTESIATSTEGYDIPLLVIGNPLPRSPEDLQNDSRIVVYIQANIHAGEVEGKEASLMFARDILTGNNSEIFRNVVLLICPNFNPDGNEKISPANRPYQNGPVNGVGLRHNGLWLDLNRDGMKAESPEVRGVISNVFNKWDPAVFMDCHTTNGSYHVEPVTFTWMVNPDGDNSLIHYMRDKMCPSVSSVLLSKYGVENCFYGEFNDMTRPEEGWFYEACDPRYMTNYYGLRNRLAVLNENYVYAGYEERVKGCYYLIRSLVEYSASHRGEIKKMLAATDALTVKRGLSPAPSDSFAVTFNVRPAPEKVTIKTFEAEVYKDENGRTRFRKSDRQKTVTVPYYIDYYPAKSVRFPYAYLITVNDPAVLNLLKIHGIKTERLSVPQKLAVERFEISELKASPRLNQGHYTNTASGKFVRDTVEFSANTIVIRSAQPLANLAAYLLEPQSGDGLLTWNFLDRYLVPQWGMGYSPCPVYRVVERQDIKTTAAEGKR